MMTPLEVTQIVAAANAASSEELADALGKIAASAEKV